MRAKVRNSRDALKKNHKLLIITAKAIATNLQVTLNGYGSHGRTGEACGKLALVCAPRRTFDYIARKAGFTTHNNKFIYLYDMVAFKMNICILIL